MLLLRLSRIGVVQYARGLRSAEAFQGLQILGILVAQDRRGQKAGVGRSRLADSQRTNRNGGTHGAGLLDIRHLSVPANSEILIQFDIALDPTRVTRVAANVDRSEGDLRAVDPEEVAAAVVERRLVDEVPTDDGVAPEQARERRQSLWWYVMLLGFALLATETVLSNRLSSRAS